MGKLNMKDWIGQTILNKKVISIPIMTHPGIELIGKTVHDAVTNGQVHYEAIKALCDKYPAAAATVIMDLTVEAEAFGAEIIFPENEVPSVSGRLLADEAAIDALEIPALNKGRIAQYLKANMLTAKNITDRPVLAGCIGPYSLAGRLYDMSEIMMLIYINPEAANTLLRKCTDFIIRYCMALKATGVNGVVMAEPAAGLLSNEDCLQRQFSGARPHLVFRQRRAPQSIHGLARLDAPQPLPPYRSRHPRPRPRPARQSDRNAPYPAR